MDTRIIKLCGIVLIYTTLLGIILPWLFSARDDIMVTIGMVLVVLTLASISSTIKYLQRLFNLRKQN